MFFFGIFVRSVRVCFWRSVHAFFRVVAFFACVFFCVSCVCVFFVRFARVGFFPVPCVWVFMRSVRVGFSRSVRVGSFVGPSTG